MKRKRFSEEQIIAVLREHETGVPTADLCRKHGMSSAHLIAARQMSERRACRVAGVERALVRYRSRRPDDAELRTR